VANRSRNAEVEPFYFGPDDCLFGAHHPPRVPPGRDLAVVLCCPLVHEYVSALRAYRALAAELAKRGFRVLRFDWYATGDSLGAGRDGRVARWLDDVETAVEWLRAEHGTLRVGLAGLRMGATLAALAAARLTEVELLALWEPVRRPARWLEELGAAHAAWLEDERQYRIGAERVAQRDELMGYDMPEALAEELGAIELDASEASYATRVLLVEDGPAPVGFGALAGHLGAHGAEVSEEHVPGERIWGAEVGFEEARVPGTIVRTVASWFDEAAR
jgi:pimeloyl-ACP methyl ester carboxylesterase